MNKDEGRRMKDEIKRRFASSRPRAAFLFLLSSFILLPSYFLSAEPLVVLPQGEFSCIVEVIPRNVPKPDPAHPEWRYAPVMKTITITRVGKIRRDDIAWSDGKVSQLWSLADKKLSVLENALHPGRPVYVLSGMLRDEACPRLLHFDADSVSWITESALVKEGGASLHYQATVKLPDTGVEREGPPPTAVYQAWIDPKTLLPLKFDDGQALYTLAFSKDAPSAPLVMPPRLQAELNRWQEALAPHPHL
ncbi:MAG: hypothetical protein WC003_16715 [Terrimicrobiaceae bacterium]